MALEQRKITASQCRFAARIFNVGSMAATLAAGLVIPVVLWFAGSIFAYAMVAHHPDPRVGQYNRIAGYRFYAWAGLLPTALIFSDSLHDLAGGTLKMWLWVWAIGILMVVPWGIRDWIRTGREDWHDITVEVEKHE